jgi:hypothetical protein
MIMIALIVFGIYFIGVVLALIVIALINGRYEDNIIPAYCTMSWFLLLFFGILYFVVYPLDRFYKWLYKIFEKKKK